MARYKYSQESGTDFKVNTDDKCDAQEDTNEVRQILDDLGELLSHSKFDDSYPKDLTVGGYLSRLNGGNDADKPSSPAVRDIYIAYDIKKIYFCFEAGTWTDIEEAFGITSTHLEDQLFFGELIGDASNQNTTGVGILYQKLGAELQFKGIHSTGNITVTDSTGTITINLDVNSTGIKLDNLGTPDDNADLNASTGYHGLLLKLDGNTSNYLRGDGSWQTPPGGDGGNVYSSGTFTVGRLTEISTTGGVIKESPFAVTTGDTFNFGAHSAGFTEQAIGTTTGTASINWSNGIKALFTRSTGSAGAVTFSFTAPPKSVNLQLTIKGSSVGSTGTITWPAAYWQGGAEPTLTGTANAIDVVSFYYSTGLTAYLGLGSANFSTV